MPDRYGYEHRMMNQAYRYYRVCGHTRFQSFVLAYGYWCTVVGAIVGAIVGWNLHR